MSKSIYLKHHICFFFILITTQDNFEKNISKFELSDAVNLLDMSNEAASGVFTDKTIRFLFIDGDHTEAGVKKDIELFFPRLVTGSIIVFDDYFDEFPGLIAAVDELIKNNNFSRIFYYRHTLVIKI